MLNRTMAVLVKRERRRVFFNDECGERFAKRLAFEFLCTGDGIRAGQFVLYCLFSLLRLDVVEP